MKISLYVIAFLLLVLGLAGFCDYGNGPSKPKRAELADTVSLRNLPGDDGCMPHTSTPPEFKHGQWWPGTCESANAPY